MRLATLGVLVRAACWMFCAALLALGAGCKPRQGGKETAGNAARDRIAPGGTLRVPLELQFSDPVFQQLDFTDPRMYALARCIELPLARASADGKVLPGLSEQWYTTDNTVWSFSLVDWPGHESDPEYSGQRLIQRWQGWLRNEPSPLQGQLSDLVAGASDYALGKAESVAGLTVNGGVLTIRLTRPNAAFPAWTTQPGLGVGSPFSPLTEGSAESRQPESPAPFYIAGASETSVKVSANPAASYGRPLLDGVEFVFSPDRSAQLEQFRSGRLDLANVDYRNSADIGDDDALVRLQSAAMIAVLIDQQGDPWGDVQFQSRSGLRQALSLSLSRAELAEIFNDCLRPWTHPLPEAYKEFLDPALVTQPLYGPTPDINLAQLRMKEADYEQGSKLPRGMDLSYVTAATAVAEDSYSDQAALTEELISYWDEVSIKLRPFPLTTEELRGRVKLGTHELLLTQLVPAYPSPDAYFYPHFYGALSGVYGNYSNLEHSEVDKLIGESQGASEEGARKLAFQRLSRLFEEECLFVPIGEVAGVVAINPRLQGYDLGPFDFDATIASQDYSRLGFIPHGESTTVDSKE